MTTTTYYTARTHLSQLFERESRQFAFCAETIPAHHAWQRALRSKLSDLTGLAQMEHCALQPQLLETRQFAGYAREKIIIQTEPDVWMPCFVLIPETVRQDQPAIPVIAAHGHASAGKSAVAGCAEIPAVQRAIARYNYDYGVQLARAGYLVFCPDARGFGERREAASQHDTDDYLVSGSCVELNQMALPLGQTVTGMWTWDLQRLIDYIETRADCDATRLGCVGLSGGGLQTLWLAAMDDRVQCAVISGYFYGCRDSLLELFNCSCNYVPHLWRAVDMGDLGALIAPRPVLIETGTDDSLNGARGLPNVTEQVDITRAAYRVFGHDERLFHHVFTGGHIWHGEKTNDFLARWLGRDDGVTSFQRQ